MKQNETYTIWCKGESKDVYGARQAIAYAKKTASLSYPYVAGIYLNETLVRKITINDLV